MSKLRPLAALLVAGPLAAGSLAAQDARTVVEPTIPTACATLSAVLVPVGDSTLADADESRLDTPRIQQAIDGCPAGRAVVLKADGARRAFLSGPLRLRAGVALVVDSGATLFGSRDPRVYEVSPNSCGVRAAGGRGCRPLILVDQAHHVGVMGGGTIDGRGWATMTGQSISWWDLAQQARSGPPQNNPRLIQATRSNDFTLYGITLRNSPNFHVVFDRGDGFTAWGVKIHTPSPNARNTDGIDPAGATNVTITRSWILTGDDNVAIKGGTRMTNVTVSHNHFYRGHGMSIGSETNGGVDRVFVTDLTVDGADNGLRIKSNASRGGLVTNVTYENVCVRKTKEPIFLDTHYSASPETTGALIPVFRDVTLRRVHVEDAGRLTLDGYDAERRLGLTFDGVTFGDPAKVKLRASHADVTLGAGGTNLSIAGDDVRVLGGAVRKDAPATPAVDCSGRFLPFPGR